MQQLATASDLDALGTEHVGAGHSLVGKILDGRYRLLRQLGSGGMGDVYGAVHVVLKRALAVKVLKSSLCDNRAALQRFQQEAEVGALLDHPSLVRVFDFGNAGGAPYMVMELLEGRDLRSLLVEERTLPLARAARLVCDALRGVGAAHACGFVHRDLKPANLFVVGREGVERCKVLDFGVTKVLRGGAISASPLTLDGKLLGTLPYMAPEQIRGRERVDGRADVYSAAAILFEALSGRRPFEADTAPELMFRVLNEQAPRLDELVANCPRPLGEIVARALSADRDARFPSAEAFVAALEPFSEDAAARATGSVSGLSIPRTDPRERRRKTRWFIGIGLVMAVGATFGPAYLHAVTPALPVMRVADPADGQASTPLPLARSRSEPLVAPSFQSATLPLQSPSVAASAPAAQPRRGPAARQRARVAVDEAAAHGTKVEPSRAAELERANPYR